MDKKPDPKLRRKFDFGFFIVIAFILLGLTMIFARMNKNDVYDLTSQDLIINATDIKSLTIEPGDNGVDYIASGKFKEKKDIGENKDVLYFEVNLTKDEYEDIYENVIVKYYGSIDYKFIENKPNYFLNFILALLPYVIIIGLMLFLFKNMGGSNNKAFDFAKSRARLNRKKTTTFDDVAGADEEKEELIEIIDFLKNPRKYTKMGVRIPKGVLLVGPPGTGKTLLARAVAGEANVPFFSISGADFVEMFVGVGAARVRDLFKTARDNAPCIVFIDEIDAVGRQRGTGMGGGHDEREQTLNQLLVEMDGFENQSGVIIMAATNRADVLDPALLRPGRFDRQITVNLPDITGRKAILKVHARNKKFAPEVKLDDIAPRIPGFSGADIENLLNEAGLLAARDNRDAITMDDIDEAVDRVLMGPAKKSKKYTPDEKKLVAYHEAGHAVIGLKLKHAQVVQKVTIIPRGMAGGYNLMLPEKETFLQTKEELEANIVSLLGGRASEELVLNVSSTGAYDDFRRATKIARSMVTEYGMSKLGPIQYESQNEGVFLGRDYLKDKNFSDQIALEIDKEVRDIVLNCFETATNTLKNNRELLDNIAKYLLEYETLTKENIQEILETGKLEKHNGNNHDEIRPEGTNEIR